MHSIQFMITLRIFRTCLFCSIFLTFNGYSQSTAYVDCFNGKCWDAETGVDLKSTVYAIVNEEKIELGKSNNSGIINLKIPTHIQALVFECDGYNSIRTPVNFSGSFSVHSKFDIGLPMSKGKTLSKKPNYVIFCIPDTHHKDFQYEFYRAKNRSFITDFSIFIKHGRSAEVQMEPAYAPGNYLLVVKSKNGEVLMERDLFIKEGLNFIDLHVDKKTEPAELGSGMQLPTMTFDTRTLYFEQGGTELKADVKLTLDSAAFYLLHYPETTVSVVGYTENVGSRERNIALSEYRARAVSTYLQQKGVKPDRIKTAWKGPDQQIKAADGNNDAPKNRRVVIQINK